MGNTASDPFENPGCGAAGATDYDLLSRNSLIEERAQPEDIARMICFTASDAARFASGAVLSVDGGATA